MTCVEMRIADLTGRVSLLEEQIARLVESMAALENRIVDLETPDAS